MPEVVEAYRKFKARGLEIVGLSIDEAGKKDKIREICERVGVTWPTIYTGEGGHGPLATRNRVAAIPASFLLDRRGRTRYTGLQGPDLERRIRDKPPDERQCIRDAESRPVLDKFKAWLDTVAPRVRPDSKLGEAIAYSQKHWHGLIRFCDDGRIAIDNNAVENAIRPFCVGRRNWLFADSVAGARSSANLYSLIVTAKANGLEPYAYLRHVFAELPKADSLEAIEALLPYRLDQS